MAENIDLILSGFQQGAKALSPLVERQYQQMDRDQPLSPYEQQVGSQMNDRLRRAQELVLAGRDPREMAVRVRMGLPLEDVPQVPSQGAPGPVASTWASGGGYSSQAPQVPPTSMGPAQPASGGPAYGYVPPPPEPAPQPQQPAQAPVPMPAQSEALMRGYAAYPAQTQQTQLQPRTRGDLETLLRVQGHGGTGGQSFADRWAIENLREEGKNQRAGTADVTKRRGQDIRQGVATAKLTESARQADDRIQLGYDSLASRLEGIRISLRGAEQRAQNDKRAQLQLQVLKLKSAQLNKKLGNIAFLLNGLNSEDQGVRDVLEDLKHEVEIEGDTLEQELVNLQSANAPAPQAAPTSAPAATKPAAAQPASTVQKVRVRHKKTGKTGNLPANSPRLQGPNAEFERIE